MKRGRILAVERRLLLSLPPWAVLQRHLLHPLCKPSSNKSGLCGADAQVKGNGRDT
jgi:hypothetical protein